MLSDQEKILDPPLHLGIDALFELISNSSAKKYERGSVANIDRLLISNLILRFPSGIKPQSIDQFWLQGHLFSGHSFFFEV